METLFYAMNERQVKIIHSNTVINTKKKFCFAAPNIR